MQELISIAVGATVSSEHLTLKLRTGNPKDGQACGKICYEAFNNISKQHKSSSSFPTVEAACDLMSRLFARSDIYSVVAEMGGQIVGSNFLWSEKIVAGIGPITVIPNIQNATVGRHLMTAVLSRAERQGLTSVRLVQAAYNNCSLALYTKLGFDVREPLVSIRGQALRLELPGYPVRLATTDDLVDCNQLCQEVHGFDRARDLRQAIGQSTATVVEADHIITGYATSIGFFGHAVGKSNENLKALIGAATSFTGQGFLLPTRNSQLFRWCLQQGLRVVEPMTLMSFGSYDRPTGAFLPSILF